MAKEELTHCFNLLALRHPPMELINETRKTYPVAFVRSGFPKVNIIDERTPNPFDQFATRDLAHDGVRKNEYGIPSGFYIRKVKEESAEDEFVRICWMPTFSFGFDRQHQTPARDLWFRVFYVTKHAISNHYFTLQDPYSISWEIGHDPFTGKKILKHLVRQTSEFYRQTRPKTSDDEHDLLDEEMQIRKEWVHCRSMDVAMRERGRMDFCVEGDCERYSACSCERCALCCLRRDDCSLSKEVVEDQIREYSCNFRRKNKNRKPTNKLEMRKFLRERPGQTVADFYQIEFIEDRIRRRRQQFQEDRESGRAQNWFMPEKFDININFPFLEQWTERMEQIRSDVPWRTILKEFAMMCGHLYSSKNTSGKMLAVVHFITNLPLASDISAQLLGKMTAWFSPNAQSNSIEGLFVPLLTLLGVTVSAFGLGSLPDDKSISNYILRLSKIGACIKSIEVLKEYSQKIAEVVLDYIRVNFFGYASADMNAWKDYDAYCDEIQEMNNTRFEERLKTEKELITKIDDLLYRGDVLMKTLEQLRIPPVQRSRFNSAYAWLCRMRNEAAHCSAGKHIPRVPPIIIHIVGKTGVGKSEATCLLNARLLTVLGHTDPSDLHTKVYYRDCGQERFDGYNSCVEGVVCDDFGSRVDTPNAPSSEAFETIRMQNSAVWQLPMASLAEKGSTFFRAKYIIWTSNRSTFKFESITNPEAVLRRVSVKYVQKPRPEFMKIVTIGKEKVETLDRAKIEEAVKVDPSIQDDIWLFDKIDPQEDACPADVVTGGYKVIRANMSFEEMASECEAELLHAQKVGKDKLDHTREYFERCVRNRGKAQGCDWFGWFGRDAQAEKKWRDVSREEISQGFFSRWMTPSTEAESSERATEWKHFDMSEILEEGVFEGQDLNTFVHEREYYEEMFRHERPRQDWRDLYGRACVQIGTRRSDVLFRQYVQAFASAMSTVEVERQKSDGLSHEQELEIFNLVMNAARFNRNLYKKCDGCEPSFWEKFWKMTKQFKRNALGYLSDKIPESWRPKLNVAYEMACSLLLSFLVTMGVAFSAAAVTQFVIWLFPQLDPERQEAERLLERAQFERTLYRNPPAELLVTIQALETRLGKKSTVTMSNAEAASVIDQEHRTRIMETASEEVRAYLMESAQERTPGTMRRNVESHQDRTNGTVRRNVESHQDRTAGSMCRNVENGSAEGSVDQNATEVMRKIKRNVYGIQLNVDGDWLFCGNLFFVVGKIAICNRHVFNTFHGREFRIFNQAARQGVVIPQDLSKAMQFSFPEENLHGKKDLVMFEMPRHVLVHADMRDYFMTKSDFSRMQQLTNVALCGYGSSLTLTEKFSDRCEARDRVDFALIDAHSKQVLVREYFRYGIQTGPGDCGSVAIAFDPSVSRKIVGIHMAANDTIGFSGTAQAVHQELLRNMQSQLVLKNVESDLDGTFEGEGDQGTAHCFGDFVDYGVVPTMTSASKTVIMPGPAHGIIATSVTIPAKLRPFRNDEGELIDPLEKARRKADTPNVPVDEVMLAQCAEHYGQKLLDLKEDDRDDGILTWEEAITGKEGDSFYNPVKRNTSPGYGWQAKGLGKEPWLGSGEEYVTDHPEVLKKRDEMMERLRAGKRASTVFVDTLKDERRPIEKVKQGKTRLFAAGEMVYCLVFRQYFAGFIAHLTRNCIGAESTVGINPFGYAWTHLANKIREVGPHVVAGDFSNYDGTLNASVMWATYDVIERFFEKATDEERRIRRGLWCDLVNSVHATTPFSRGENGKQTFLYQWSHSQPSGNPMTVILNSVYHSLVARYVWKLCARKFSPTLVGLDNFDRFVRHVNYGDDDIYNIHPDVVEWFNQITMSEAFREIGMEYTDEAKTGELVAHRTIDEIAFLKRKFRWDAKQCRWRCPHSMETIKEMAMWVKRKANPHVLTAEVMEEAVHELAQHEKEVFEREIVAFQEARKIVAKYWPVCLLTYEEYEEIDLARLDVLVKTDPRDQKVVDAIFY